MKNLSRRLRFSCAPIVVSVVTLLSIVTTTTAQQPLPADAALRGKTLPEWSQLHNEWAIATDLGGATLPNTVDGMRFLPFGFGGGDFEFDVSVAPGTGFVSAPWFAFGELYEDGSFDDPSDPFLIGLLEFIFENRTVDVWLDGDLVQSGTVAELINYTYGPAFFDTPIFYSAPGASVAALWSVGVGGVYHPMPAGEHTMVVFTDGPIFGPTMMTYHITVGD